MWWKKPQIVYIDTRILFFRLVILFLVFTSIVFYWRWTRVTEIQFVSRELASSWVVRDRKVIDEVCQGLKQSYRLEEKVDRPSGILLRIYSMKEIKQYWISDDGYILEAETGKVFRASSAIGRIAETARRELKIRSPFGDMLTWAKVREIIPVGEQMTLRDLDSGARFKVKRTGGYSHADIEPVTKSDTEIIKKLYGGSLSWKRKAVIVEFQRHRIAASFTGAAAGNGEIRDNDITGKMNLYFNDSNSNDGRNLSHQVMIWKAGGKVREKLKKLTPEKTIMVLLTAIDQRDPRTMNLILSQSYRKNIDRVIGVTVRHIKKTAALKYRLTVSVSLKGGPYNDRRIINLNLQQDRINGGFKVEGGFLKDLLT